MISEAPNAQFNKYLLVRASKPPSEMALSAYFITRPGNPSPFWDELSSLLSEGATSAQVLEAANRYLEANDISGIANFSALAAGSIEIARLISEGVREGDIQTVNDLVKQRYSTLFAQGGVGLSIRQVVWDQLAAHLVSGSGLEVGDVLLRVLRVLHIAEYQTRKGVNADERILGADVVIPIELRAFIDLAQRDLRREKKEAEAAAATEERTATVRNVRQTLLARAGKQFLLQAMSSREAAPLPMGAAQIETDGQVELVHAALGKIELVLNARALSRLHTIPELENFLLSISPMGALATQDTRVLLRALDVAASACDSVLLGSLPTAALVRADKELDAASQMIANGATLQIQLLAEQIAIRLSLGALSSASKALNDVSHPNPIQPAGIGDLKIVKQQLQKYALGEVAHIENVLAGETRERVHTLLDRTEQQLIIETEETTESEKDLQSTVRFELSQELESMRKEEKQSEAGINVTASYGAVSMSANAKTSNSQTAEQSLKISQKSVRETVSRAIERIQKRTRRQQTVIMISERTETNRHTFEAGEESRVGMYRLCCTNLLTGGFPLSPDRLIPRFP